MLRSQERFGLGESRRCLFVIIFAIILSLFYQLFYKIILSQLVYSVSVRRRHFPKHQSGFTKKVPIDIVKVNMCSGSSDDPNFDLLFESFLTNYYPINKCKGESKTMFKRNNEAIGSDLFSE